MASNAWSAEELNILSVYYGTMPNIELQRTHLPDRNVRAIELKAMRMGLSQKQSDVSWSQTELNILKNASPGMTPKDIHNELLPGRSIHAITLKLQALKNPNGRRANRTSQSPTKNRTPWTEDEKEILRTCYTSMSVKAIHDNYLPNRSCHAIENMARVIMPPKGQKWLPSEIIILKRYYKKIPVTQIIADHLPGKTRNQINRMAQKLELTKPIAKNQQAT